VIVWILTVVISTSGPNYWSRTNQQYGDPHATKAGCEAQGKALVGRPVWSDSVIVGETKTYAAYVCSPESLNP